MSKHTQSDNFEHELDEFFKERALFRTQTVADTAKSKVAKERSEDEIKHLDAKEGSQSGCCMTGCYDCPWEYAG